ncbi:hypothetical protein HDU67_008599 [Dinochytrium kinnereticum]|nr:hypothetical protein HDU67_008599 [Dinochytrium kinnereticum]
MPSTFEVPDRLKHFADPPPNSGLFEKFSHALPLPLHVVLVGLSVAYNVTLAIIVHLIDGPIKESWDLATSIIHAILRTFVMRHPPQGRHSLPFLKVCTDFTVPGFAANARVSSASVHIRGDALLRAAVRSAVGLPPVPSHPDPSFNSNGNEGGSRVGGEGPSVPHQQDDHLNPATLRRIEGEWIVNRSVIPKPKADSRVILYIHGGAQYLLSPRTHRGLISQISKDCQCPAYAVDYRLCPTDIFPSSLLDVVAAYLALIGENHRPPGLLRHSLLGKGFQARINGAADTVKIFTDFEVTVPRASGGNQESRGRGSIRSLNLLPSQVVIAGDSSGGCITVQLLVTLKALGLPMPAGAVVLSPFVDNELKSDSWRRNHGSDYLSIDQLGLRWLVRNMVCNPLIPDNHPVFSPAHAELTGLCPLLIQVGDSEVLTDDSVMLHENAVAAGVKSELQIYKDMFHVFQAANYDTAFPIIPSSLEATRRIGVFVKNLPTSAQSSTTQSSITQPSTEPLPQKSSHRHLHCPDAKSFTSSDSSTSLMISLGRLRGLQAPQPNLSRDSLNPDAVNDAPPRYDAAEVNNRGTILGKRMMTRETKEGSNASSVITLVQEGEADIERMRISKGRNRTEALFVQVGRGRVVEERVSTGRFY